MSVSSILPREGMPVAVAPASTPSVAPATAVTATEGPSPFARMLQGLGDESNRGEAMVQSAMHAGAHGGTMGAADLLALQAGVYRYGEVVDLASRLVDRASSGVKTVLQGQGQ